LTHPVHPEEAIKAKARDNSDLNSSNRHNKTIMPVLTVASDVSQTQTVFDEHQRLK